MTRAQTMIVWLGVAVSTILAIYPPWLRTVALTHAGTITAAAERAWIWAGPSPADAFAREESALAAKPNAGSELTEPDPWAKFRTANTESHAAAQTAEPQVPPRLIPLGLASASEAPTPPELRSWLGFQMINRSEVLGARLVGVRVDVARLLVEIVVVAMVTGATVLTLRGRRGAVGA